jgi:hypothetical protein
MWSKRTLGASGYAEAQEDAVEPAHASCTCASCTCANCTCSNYAGADRTCTCSSRVRITGTGRYARFWRIEEQPIGRGGQALIRAVA